MVNQKSISSTAKMHGYCNYCGWPVVFACINDEFLTVVDTRYFDYWYYCSNKGCYKHEGEGCGDMDIPDWVII